MAYLKAKISIHLAKEAKIAFLLTIKVTVLNEYLDFADIFSKEWAAELLERSDIKKYAIYLKPGKISLYRLIYNLGPVELKTLKTYIEINLANGFISLSNSPARALILFIWKLDSSLWLCVD